jgi:hypothetical protein
MHISETLYFEYSSTSLYNPLLVAKQRSYFSGLDHLNKTGKALLQDIKEENDKDKEQQLEDIE